MSVYCQSCRFSYAGPCPKHGGAVEQIPALPELKDGESAEVTFVKVENAPAPETKPKKPSLIKRIFNK